MCHTLDALGGHGKGVVKRVFMESLCWVSDLEWIEGYINTLGDKVRMSTYCSVHTKCKPSDENCALEFKVQSLQNLKSIE